MTWCSVADDTSQCTVGGGSESDVSLYSEATFGFSSLVTVYHDYILSTADTVIKSFHTGSDSTQINNAGVFAVRMVLTVLGQMEVALEIFGEHHAGDELDDAYGKWFFIRVIETLKAGLRLFLLSKIWKTEGSLLRSGGIYSSPDPVPSDSGAEGEGAAAAAADPMGSLMSAITGDSSTPQRVTTYGRNSGMFCPSILITAF